MSKPRYDWWPYVKGMIRRYPELCARQEELRRTKMSPNLTGMPGAHGQTSDPVADAALRELPEINRRELEAVRQAIEETRPCQTVRSDWRWSSWFSGRRRIHWKGRRWSCTGLHESW